MSGIWMSFGGASFPNWKMLSVKILHDITSIVNRKCMGAHFSIDSHFGLYSISAHFGRRHSADCCRYFRVLFASCAPRCVSKQFVG